MADHNRAGTVNRRRQRRRAQPTLGGAQDASLEALQARLEATPAATTWWSTGDALDLEANHGAIWQARFDSLSTAYDGLALVCVG